jgi:hypothetical protein
MLFLKKAYNQQFFRMEGAGFRIFFDKSFINLGKPSAAKDRAFLKD